MKERDFFCGYAWCELIVVMVGDKLVDAKGKVKYNMLRGSCLLLGVGENARYE